MGAFLLYGHNSSIILEKAKAVFIAKDFDHFIERRFNDYSLILYQKQIVNHLNYIESDGNGIYATGTLIYKAFSYEESLQNLLLDICRDQFNQADLRGNYFILINRKGELSFLNDPTDNYAVYYNVQNQILSSSFLALFESLPKSHHDLNHEAIREVLLTGNLIGASTLVKSIKRLMCRDHVHFRGLKNKTIPPQISKAQYENYHQALQSQVEILRDYFVSIRNFADELGVNSGLTGGLDSRLLFILINQKLGNYQFYSTMRKERTIDYSIAEKLCRIKGIKLASVKNRSFAEMEEEEFLHLLDQNYVFNDGQIRTHQLWTEEINAPDYRTKLIGNKRIAFSGVGGEQYRNNERLIEQRVQTQKWIEYDLIKKYSGNPFVSQNFKNEFIGHLKDKIYYYLDIEPSNTFLDYFHIKRYFNEIYNPANRLLRNNIENQLYFFLSPFTDYEVSRSAYNIIPFLGSGFQFEMDLIRMLDENIAGVESNYGFSLDGRESVKNKLIPYIKKYAGYQMYHRLYQARKNEGNIHGELKSKFPAIADIEKDLMDLPLNINLEVIKKNSFLSPLLIEVAYFLKNF